jgi:outer membrane murein-binding lipoprotein Lpp
MNPRIRVMALVLSVLLLLVIIELVRKRKLREEYSWLWIITGIAIFVVAAWQSLVIRITELIGAKIIVSTLFFGGLMFLTVISIHFSTKVSQLSEQVKRLAQQTALLAERVERMEGSGQAEAGGR